MDAWIEDVTRMGLAVAPGMTLEWAEDPAAPLQTIDGEVTPVEAAARFLAAVPPGWCAKAAFKQLAGHVVVRCPRALSRQEKST